LISLRLVDHTYNVGNILSFDVPLVKASGYHYHPIQSIQGEMNEE
jgi:hypothetical protein